MKITHHITPTYYVDIETGEQIRKHIVKKDYIIIRTIKNKSNNNESARTISYTKQCRRKKYEQGKLQLE